MKQLFLDRKVLSWALYDWANSAFATTVMAGFFPIFYSAISRDISLADSQFWFNVTLAVSGLAVAIAAPVLGAVADAGGGRRKFLATFAFLGVAMSAGLAWVQSGMWWMGLLLYGLGKVGFSGANVFYDAMLVDVAPEDDVDLVSGFGYSMGYIGGGLLFLLNVLMVQYPETFGLPDAATAVSVSFLSVAVWWAVFTVPLLLQDHNNADSTQRPVRNLSESIRHGLTELKGTITRLRHYRVLVLFLVGYWLYIDGVGTIIKSAVFFGSRVLELPQSSLITALLLTQFVAFPSALAFGWLGKKIGARPGILIGLGVYVMAIVYAWGWLTTAGDFFVLAVAIGLVQGGVQSLSRSLYARLIPTEHAAEFFGFYNMVGKFASILGPTLMSGSVLLFAAVDERDSILALLVLFISGGLLLASLDLDQTRTRSGTR